MNPGKAVERRRAMVVEKKGLEQLGGVFLVAFVEMVSERVRVKRLGHVSRKGVSEQCGKVRFLRAFWRLTFCTVCQTKSGWAHRWSSRPRVGCGISSGVSRRQAVVDITQNVFNGVGSPERLQSCVHPARAAIAVQAEEVCEGTWLRVAEECVRWGHMKRGKIRCPC